MSSVFDGAVCAPTRSAGGASTINPIRTTHTRVIRIDVPSAPRFFHDQSPRSRISAMADAPGDVTGLLLEWRGGDERALDRLIPLVHGQLRRIAGRCIRRERAGHTLQATALVNEAYLRLVDAKRVEWRDRAHFLAIAARLMRRVLVDYARARGYQKRGGGAVRV